MFTATIEEMHKAFAEKADGSPFKWLLYHLLGTPLVLFGMLIVAPLMWPIATFIWYRERS